MNISILNHDTFIAGGYLTSHLCGSFFNFDELGDIDIYFARHDITEQGYVMPHNTFLTEHLLGDGWVTNIGKSTILVNYTKPDYKIIQTIDLTYFKCKHKPHLKNDNPYKITDPRISDDNLPKKLVYYYDLPPCSIYYNNNTIHIMGRALKSILTHECTIIEYNIDSLTGYSPFEAFYNYAYAKHYKSRLEKYISRGFTLYYEDLTSNEKVDVTGLNIDTICDSVSTNLFGRKMWRLWWNF